MAIVFEGHGEFTFRREGRMLLYKISGPWNFEKAVEYNAHLLEQIKQPEMERGWGRIMDMQDYELCSMDAMEELTRVIDEELNLGCVCRCYVHLAPRHYQLVEMKYKTSPPVMFDSQNDAEKFCLQQLARNT
jgi:hypothetical protein